MLASSNMTLNMQIGMRSPVLSFELRSQPKVMDLWNSLKTIISDMRLSRCYSYEKYVTVIATLCFVDNEPVNMRGPAASTHGQLCPRRVSTGQLIRHERMKLSLKQRPGAASGTAPALTDGQSVRPCSNSWLKKVTCHSYGCSSCIHHMYNMYILCTYCT